MIDKEIIELKKKFWQIRDMGYVKATRGGSTGIGKTFEDLIGKKEDTESLPDYKGIEIKTKRGYSKGYITLFCYNFLDNTPNPALRIKDRYGYPDHQLKNCKILQTSIYANKYTLVACKWWFKLKVAKDEQKIYLLIYDRNYNLREKDCYWNFCDLQERLETKLTYLAFAKAWPTTRDNEVYYKYYKMDIYKLKSFEDFINLIVAGKIRVTIKLGVYKSGPKMGNLDNHGISFDILADDLNELFLKI